MVPKNRGYIRRLKHTTHYLAANLVIGGCVLWIFESYQRKQHFRHLLIVLHIPAYHPRKIHIVFQRLRYHASKVSSSLFKTGHAPATISGQRLSYVASYGVCDLFYSEDNRIAKPLALRLGLEPRTP